MKKLRQTSQALARSSLNWTIAEDNKEITQQWRGKL